MRQQPLGESAPPYIAPRKTGTPENGTMTWTKTNTKTKQEHQKIGQGHGQVSEQTDQKEIEHKQRDNFLGVIFRLFAAISPLF